ncbi:MAG: DUF5685 family protein [Candidatus Methanoplasma sp.]|jgi:hypothetical protein|nr:DUF5685 family protein [Candidatus Methanoplasma sp.]
MLGYIVPSYGKLSASDLGRYRRFYCEGCHRLREGYGLASTVLVSFDMTFAHIALAAVAGERLEKAAERRAPLCVFGRCAQDSEISERVAACTVLSAKWELEDDRVDGWSVKSGLASVALGRAIERAERAHGDLDEAIGRGFAALRSMEAEGRADAVAMGRAFGRPMAEALAGSEGSPAARLLEGMSAAVYVLDAIDDLEDDFASGAYNPYLEASGAFANKRAYVERNARELAADVREAMDAARSAYLEVRGAAGDSAGILDNIIYLGMRDSAKRVLSGERVSAGDLRTLLCRRDRVPPPR